MLLVRLLGDQSSEIRFGKGFHSIYYKKSLPVLGFKSSLGP